jgi:hypothetical protein
MWMPAQTTTPPLRTARNAAGMSDPTGAKISAASSSNGAGASLSPAHAAPSERAKACACMSPLRVNAAISRPSMTRDLRDDVRRRAEAVDADAPGLARHAQRAVADEARAQPRRNVDVANAARKREAVTRIGDR